MACIDPRRPYYKRGGHAMGENAMRKAITPCERRERHAIGDKAMLLARWSCYIIGEKAMLWARTPCYMQARAVAYPLFEVSGPPYWVTPPPPPFPPSPLPPPTLLDMIFVNKHTRSSWFFSPCYAVSVDNQTQFPKMSFCRVNHCRPPESWVVSTLFKIVPPPLPPPPPPPPPPPHTHTVLGYRVSHKQDNME